MKNEEQYRTKDLYFSAALIALGHKNFFLEELSPRIFLFVFSISNSLASELENNFWQRKLLISARDYSDAISELKTKIYRGVG